jgi:Rrf2 family protein
MRSERCCSSPRIKNKDPPDPGIVRARKYPGKFLEQILLHLRNEGLLTSKRGVGGGYSLRKRASDIVVLEIVELLDGPIAPLPCALERPGEPCGCPDPTRCPLRPLMRQAREMMRDLFSSKTVQDLLDESRGEHALAFEI